MINQFQSDPATLDRYRCGSLGLHLDSFANWLSEQGYPRQTGMQKLRLFAFLSRWLERDKISLQQLDEQRIDHFLKTQPERLRRQRQVRHTLTQLLHHLRRLRVVPDQQSPQAKSSTDRLLCDYERFLAQERALSPTTLNNYGAVARRFLANAFATKALQLDRLGAKDINGFVLREKAVFSPKRVQLPLQMATEA